MLEFTYVMIKPDGVKQNILEDVVSTFKENNLGVFNYVITENVGIR